MRAWLSGVGLWGDGLPGWNASRKMLNGGAPYAPSAIVLPECALLPPNERRRAVDSVKLALVTANEAVLCAGQDPARLETTFASSGGDNPTLHAILEALATPERHISPTRFHNSVHNAAAGYWHIATKCREASTSLCAHDESFGVGLVDAVSRMTMEGGGMLLVAYDHPYPAPLDSVRPIVASFGVAFVLSPTPTGRDIANMDIELGDRSLPVTRLLDPLLEKLRRGNPAARSLPILSALAHSRRQEIALEYVAGNRLQIIVDPLEGAGAAQAEDRALPSLGGR